MSRFSASTRRRESQRSTRLGCRDVVCPRYMHDCLCSLASQSVLSDERPPPVWKQVFVAFIVLSGIGIVLGIPYMMYFKKNPKSKAYSLLNNGRKQLAGHKH